MCRGVFTYHGAACPSAGSPDARSDHTDHIGHLHRSDRPSWAECGSATQHGEGAPGIVVRAPSHASTLPWSALSPPRRTQPESREAAFSSSSSSSEIHRGSRHPLPASRKAPPSSRMHASFLPHIAAQGKAIISPSGSPAAERRRRTQGSLSVSSSRFTAEARRKPPRLRALPDPPPSCRGRLGCSHPRRSQQARARHRHGPPPRPNAAPSCRCRSAH